MSIKSFCTILLSFILFTGNMALASSSSFAKFCWEKDGKGGIEKAINSLRGTNFQHLSIDTSEGGYIMIPEVYNSWRMETGFKLIFSNSMLRLTPLKITSNKKLPSRTILVKDVEIQVENNECNDAHECSFTINMHFKVNIDNSIVDYAKISVGVRKHTAMGISFGTLGNIDIVTYKDCSKL